MMYLEERYEMDEFNYLYIYWIQYFTSFSLSSFSAFAVIICFWSVFAIKSSSISSCCAKCSFSCLILFTFSISLFTNCSSSVSSRTVIIITGQGHHEISDSSRGVLREEIESFITPELQLKAESWSSACKIAVRTQEKWFCRYKNWCYISIELMKGFSDLQYFSILTSVSKAIVSPSFLVIN